MKNTKTIKTVKEIKEMIKLTETKIKAITEKLVPLSDTKTRLTRKQHALILFRRTNVTTSKVSSIMGITRRNLSSLINYLRNDGYDIVLKRAGTEYYVSLNMAL